MVPKTNSRLRVGCFRQLSLPTRLIIIAFHTFTLLTLAALLGTTVQSRILQRKLRNDLLKTNIGKSGNQIEITIFVGVGFRLLAIIIGFHSVRTRHSPGMVIALSAIVLITGTLMTVSGISIFAKYGSLKWVREFLEKEIEGIDSHWTSTEVTRFIGKLQSERECCGVDSYKDWQNFSFGITSLRVPSSCCLPSRRALNSTLDYCGQNLLPEHPQAEELIYTRGCLAVLTAEIVKLLSASAFLCILIGSVDGVLATFGIVLVLKGYV